MLGLFVIFSPPTAEATITGQRCNWGVLPPGDVARGHGVGWLLAALPPSANDHSPDSTPKTLQVERPGFTFPNTNHHSTLGACGAMGCSSSKLNLGFYFFRTKRNTASKLVF